MQRLRTAAVLSCAALLACGAPVDAGAAGKVLDRVPAGSAGYLVINNVKAATDGVDKFLVDIGLDKMTKEKMPQGLLAMIRQQLNLGEGLDVNGGFAVVMLDPKPFGVDLVEMFMGRGAPPIQQSTVPSPTPGPAAGPPKPPPVVVLVPGKGVKEVFGAYKPEAAGEFMKIKFDQEVYAAASGGYVLLSPSLPALKAALAPQKSAASELSKAEAKMIASSAAAVRVNIKVLRPVLEKLLDVAAKQSPAQGPEAAMMNMAFGSYKQLLKELDALTLAARFAKTGAVVEGVMTVKPDSVYASYYQPVTDAKQLLAKVPDLKYVLAMGMAPMTKRAREQYRQEITRMMDPLLKMMQQAEEKFTAEHAEKIKKVAMDLGNQVQSMQMVGGGPAGENGAFGVSLVLNCKDASQLKSALADGAALIAQIVKEVGGESEVKDLKIAYVKGAEQVGGASVDAVTITSPELSAKMKEGDRAAMKAIFGEDKVRILVGTADANTVVITFGGGTEMMAKALATAKAGNGAILQSAGAAEAMKHMPRKPTQLVLFNGGNLVELILAGMRKIEPDAALPFTLTCKTPVAMGVAQGKNAMSFAIYVPSKLVKEAVSAFMMQAGPPQPPPPVVPGGDDF